MDSSDRPVESLGEAIGLSPHEAGELVFDLLYSNEKMSNFTIRIECNPVRQRGQ